MPPVASALSIAACFEPRGPNRKLTAVVGEPVNLCRQAGAR
jgi:hypothetical protein